MEVTVFGKQYYIKKVFLLVFALVITVGSGVLGFYLKQVYQPLREPVVEYVTTTSEAYPEVKTDDDLDTEKEESKKIKVYVVGCVSKPGVVTLSKGAVIEDAIREAGGATKEADLDNINLAFEINENVMLRIKEKSTTHGITIPANSGVSKNDKSPKANSSVKQVSGAKQPGTAGKQPGAEKASSTKIHTSTEVLNSGVDIVNDSLGAVVTDEQEKSGENSKSKLININTASQAELEDLPNVGPATAKAILDFRDKNGKFSKITDIMKITGIKQKTFDKIKDYICV